MLDRGKVPGGRMASRRFAGRYVDLGASYLTVSDPAFERALAGTVRAWTDRFHVWEDGELHGPKAGPMRWAGDGGMRAIVTALTHGLEVRQQVHVNRVTQGSVDGEAFDAVVLAMPDPQALAILDPSLTQERATISGRTWDPVLVLAARWDARPWEVDGVFVHDDPVLEWVADDGSRRGDGAAVLTAHSTPAFASTRLAEPAEAADEMVAALTRLGIREPAEVLRVQRWTYAKPVGTRSELFFLSSKGIGFCGDGWGRPRIEGAWLSGRAIGQALSS